MATMFKSFYDIGKITIWADGEGISEEAGRARLTLSFRDGNPRIVVNTGEMGVAGMINFPMDAYTFGAVIEAIKEIISSDPGTRISIDSLATKWENDKPTNQQFLVSVLHIGKSKEGVIYLSVVDEAKPKIVFPLKPSKFHNFRDHNKEPLADSRISAMLARGLAQTLSGILSNMVVDYTAEAYKLGQYKPSMIKGFENLGSGSSQPKAKKQTITELDSEMGAILEDLDL